MNDLIEDLQKISRLPSNLVKETASFSAGIPDEDAEEKFIDLNPNHSENIRSLLRLIDFIADVYARSGDYEKEKNAIDFFIASIIKSDTVAELGWSKIKDCYKILEELFDHKKELAIKSRFSSITELSLTADLRPIFTLDRNEIRKFVYPLILNLKTNDERKFTCELSLEQLDFLNAEIKNAKNKIRLLENFVDRGVNNG